MWRVHCCGNFWEKHSIFSPQWWYLMLANISHKVKNSSPRINTIELTVAEWPHSPQCVPPHPSLEHKAQHSIWWNKPLIRTNTFLSLLASTSSSSGRIRKHSQLTPHSFKFCLNFSNTWAIYFPNLLCKTKAISNSNLPNCDLYQCSVKLQPSPRIIFLGFIFSLQKSS